MKFSWNFFWSSKTCKKLLSLSTNLLLSQLDKVDRVDRLFFQIFLDQKWKALKSWMWSCQEASTQTSQTEAIEWFQTSTCACQQSFFWVHFVWDGTLNWFPISPRRFRTSLIISSLNIQKTQMTMTSCPSWNYKFVDFTHFSGKNCDLLSGFLLPVMLSGWSLYLLQVFSISCWNPVLCTQIWGKKYY